MAEAEERRTHWEQLNDKVRVFQIWRAILYLLGDYDPRSKKRAQCAQNRA